MRNALNNIRWTLVGIGAFTFFLAVLLLFTELIGFAFQPLIHP